MIARNGFRLPRGYHIYDDGSDFVYLLRPDGSRVAVFSRLGATRESIEE